MGSDIHTNVGPWHPDPMVSLRAIQHRVFQKHYDLIVDIPEMLRSTRNSIASCVGEGDPYNLVPVFERDLNFLEHVSQSPLPESLDEQIKILRRMWESGGEGLGNILDIEDISESGGICRARPLTDDELQNLFGTTRPSLPVDRESWRKFQADLDRGDCVCFPVFDDDQPVGWYFAGATID